jgi:hypothetical protein
LKTDKVLDETIIEDVQPLHSDEIPQTDEETQQIEEEPQITDQTKLKLISLSSFRPVENEVPSGKRKLNIPKISQSS